MRGLDNARSLPRASAPLALAFATSVVIAQPSSSELDGRWTGSVQGAGGETAIEVVIRGDAGSWRAIPARGRNRENACAGKEFPFSMTRAQGPHLVLHVEGSKALQGCPDFRVRLERPHAGMLEGSLPNGAKVRLGR